MARKLKQAAAGLIGLGLVGGVGAVAYDEDGTAKVTITDKKTGKTESVTIEGDKGRMFSCPSGTSAKLEPIDLAAGPIKITLRRVERRIDRIDKNHPGKSAPAAVVNRYPGLLRRDKRLVAAFNEKIGDWE